MNRRISRNIAPVLTPKEQEIIDKALSLLATRNYSVTDGGSLLVDIFITGKEYTRLRDEAELCTKLRNRFQKIYLEKVDRGRRK